MRKLLILLGAARYPKDRDLALASFAPSHAAFRAAMTGGKNPIVASNDLLDLFDTDAPWSDQQLEIESWLKERAPPPAEPRALLIHYLGHGGLADGNSQFFMAINSTNKFDALGSSISRASFSHTLNKAARLFRKYLIIDCCFAANVIEGMMGQVESMMTAQLSQVGGALKDDSRGFAAICSSDSISTSNALGRNGLTQFTDAFIETLRQGDPYGEDYLTFENVRTLIASRLDELYGDGAVPPASKFDDNVQGPIHRLGLFPNLAERRRPPRESPVRLTGVSLAISEKDSKRFETIRKATAELERVFAAHPTSGVRPAKLQDLARPIAAAGKSLTSLAIVDELLDTQEAPRDAAVFAAAVIIYLRVEHDYFDRLVAIAADGKRLRGAPMWRVLRAIKRLCAGVDITPQRWRDLVAALSNLARNYDTTKEARFRSRDIVLMIAQTAKLKRLRINLKRDGIFSEEQLQDWAQFNAAPKPEREHLDGPTALRSQAPSALPRSLRNELRQALFAATKAGKKDRVAALRLILASLIEQDAEQRTAPDPMEGNALVIDTLQKMAKQRVISIEMYDQAGREDLATVERGELVVIEEFLRRSIIISLSGRCGSLQQRDSANSGDTRPNPQTPAVPPHPR